MELHRSFPRAACTLFVLLGSILLFSCTNTFSFQKELHSLKHLEQLVSDSLEAGKTDFPFLMVHMQSGNIYAFNEWTVDSLESRLEGFGLWMNPYRDKLRPYARYPLGLPEGIDRSRIRMKRVTQKSEDENYEWYP